MKKCPQCGREYDLSMSFCLDDGSELLYGPAMSGPGAVATGFRVDDEPQTALLSEPPASAGGQSVSENPTRPFVHATAEAEPRSRLGEVSERPSVSAHRAAGPPTAGGRVSEMRSFAARRVKPLIGAAIAVAILVAGFFGYRYFTPTKQIESIAVMPFVNETGNQDAEYLSDGMTETLIGSLSQLPNLSVKARSSVFRYKGKETDPQTVGKELNVQAVLNGRVVQRGQDLILYVELVDAETENVLWKADYNRQMTNLVSLQTEIARDVSQKLKTKLSGADEQKLTKNYTENAEAYQLYLKGRFYWNKRNPKDLQKAIEYFQQAIAVDPNYALAYAGLADSYSLIPTYGGQSPREWMPKAKEAALTAVRLDDQLGEAHASLGFVLEAFDYDFAGAERELKRALELNPNYATAHQWNAERLSHQGKFDEAAAEFKRALELDPFSTAVNWSYGMHLYMERRYDEALAQIKKTTEQDPNFQRAHIGLSFIYRQKNDYVAAIEEVAKIQESAGNAERARLTRETFARGGWKEYLRLTLDENRSSGQPSYARVIAYAQLGEKDKAFAEFNQLYENREFGVTLLKIEPSLDPLRDDPRFQELLRKVGFPE